MCRRTRLIEKARLYARANTDHIYALAAVVVKGGKVIGCGANNHLRHAEVEAIRRCHKNPSGAMMIVVRDTATGVAMAKPCEACQRAIREAGITRVFYTTRTGLERLW